MKNKTYHTAEQSHNHRKGNIDTLNSPTITEKGNIDTLSTQILDRSLSWLGTDTSIKKMAGLS